jgi:hypothetical protein
MSVNPPATVTNLLLNTLTTSKIVFLPAASTMSGHLYTIKDICGNAYTSSIFLSTTGLDTIDANATRATMSTQFGAVTLASDGLTNWMILQHKIFTFFFTPVQVPNLSVWYDAADAGTLSTSGSTITSWRDKSGSGFTATAANSPTYGTTVVNGNNTVSLNGTNQSFSTSFTINSALHSFVVVHKPNTLASSTSLLRFQSASYVVFPYYFNAAPHGYITIYDGPLIGEAGTTLLDNSSTTNFNIVVVTIQSGSQVIFRDGTQQSATSEALSSTTTPSLRIGSLSGTSEFYGGSIGEIMVFNSFLTTTQRQQLEGYLAWKWGRVSALPANHPFKTVRP